MEMHDGYGETPEYEIERMRNIRANEQLMESLGLGSSPSASSLRAVSSRYKPWICIRPSLTMFQRVSRFRSPALRPRC